MPAGSRETRQKNEIMSVLASFGAEHFSCDDVEDRLRERGIRIAKSTIYRFINRECAAGAVRRFTFPGNMQACFQYVSDGSGCNGHLHMVCNSCGGVVHFDSGGLAAAAADVSGRLGIRLLVERTVFSGECGECLSGKTAGRE